MKYFTITPCDGGYLYKDWVPFACTGRFGWFFQALFDFEQWVYRRLNG